MPDGLRCDPGGGGFAKCAHVDAWHLELLAVGLFVKARDLQINLKLKMVSTAGVEVILRPLWMSPWADLHLLPGEAEPVRLPWSDHSP